MAEQYRDNLTPGLLHLLDARGDAAYTRLVPPRPGAAGDDVRPALAALTSADLLTVSVASPPDAEALLAGAWLWHDFLDESHAISQRLPGPTGGFWHAIMHRREGDFPNAKYWYARCRTHPALAEVGRRAGPVLSAPGGAEELHRLTPGGGWDPDRFVDLVARVHDDPSHRLYPSAVALQRLEWQALFDHCARAAGGK